VAIDSRHELLESFGRVDYSRPIGHAPILPQAKTPNPI
jgi:hypothetical protein